MKAIWSFWTKPFEKFHSGCWPSEKHHLMSWVLSVETARRHYPDTLLVTDNAGATLLVDKLGLKFKTVSTELNKLNNIDAEWWALGKLHTYRTQTEAFVHIDSDVYLWNPLPEDLANAAVFAQNPERFEPGYSCYRPHLWDTVLTSICGWLPEEWKWYSGCSGNEAVCCGILGGQHTQFISHYADSAIKLVTHPSNRKAWPLVADRIGDNILFEQYFLSACLQYHQKRNDSPFYGIYAKYLFESEQAAYDSRQAQLAGFTHLIAGAKRNPELAKRLETRVHKEYPRLFNNIRRIMNDKT